MTKSNIFYSLAALCACAALPSAAFARSADDDGPRTETVSYADLDLTHAVGRHVLEVRIHAAAGRVCGPNPEWRDLEMATDYRGCMQRAQQEALQVVAMQEKPRSSVELAANGAAPSSVGLAGFEGGGGAR